MACASEVSAQSALACVGADATQPARPQPSGCTVHPQGSPCSPNPNHRSRLRILLRQALPLFFPDSGILFLSHFAPSRSQRPSGLFDGLTVIRALITHGRTPPRRPYDQIRRLSNVCSSRQESGCTTHPNTGPNTVSRIGSAAEALIRENTVWLPEWLLAAFRPPV